MKTLYLVRHAKSSWEFPEITDLERPLNTRGKRDAPIMGRWAKEQGILPERILSSHSVRTLATSSKLAHALGMKGEKIETETLLYHAGVTSLENVIRSCPSSVNSLMLVGHNPGLTELANKLCPSHMVENIPTCGMYAIQFAVESWSDMSAKKAEFLFFQYPKKLSNTQETSPG